jgi:lipopolysaccharide heptosyltransferase I
VRLTSLGDVVHTLPVAAALRRYRPHDQIVWIVEEREQILLAGNPAVDHVIVAPLRRWRQLCLTGHIRRATGEIRAFVKTLRACHIDAVIDVQGWWQKTSPIVALTRAPCRIGFSRQFARDPLSPLFTAIHVSPPPHARHIVDQNLALLTPLGIESPAAEFVLPVWPDAEQRVQAWTSARGLQTRGFIALLPSTRGRKKLWPAAAYADLARRLGAGAAVPVVLAGGPSDAKILAAVTAGAPDVHVYTPEAISDLAVFLGKPRTVIGNDTGPLHLAAAANVPSLGLFGPTSGVRNGPYGRTGHFIQSETGRMRDISVDQVLKTTLQIVRD